MASLPHQAGTLGRWLGEGTSALVLVALQVHLGGQYGSDLGYKETVVLQVWETLLGRSGAVRTILMFIVKTQVFGLI